MALFSKRDLVRSVPLNAEFDLAHGRVTLSRLDIYHEGMSLHVYAQGESRISEEPVLFQRYQALMDEGRPEEAESYRRLHANEWNDLTAGVAPWFGNAVDFEFSDDAETSYGFLMTTAGGDEHGWAAEYDIQPAWPNVATEFTIVTYFTGRAWIEVDTDPIDHAGEPSHTTVIDLTNL
jgi:hypothetical protein